MIQKVTSQEVGDTWRNMFTATSYYCVQVFDVDRDYHLRRFQITMRWDGTPPATPFDIYAYFSGSGTVYAINHYSSSDIASAPSQTVLDFEFPANTVMDRNSLNGEAVVVIGDLSSSVNGQILIEANSSYDGYFVLSDFTEQENDNAHFMLWGDDGVNTQPVAGATLAGSIGSTSGIATVNT
jgi:hypothetical protein